MSFANAARGAAGIVFVLGACTTASQDRVGSYGAEMDAYILCKGTAARKIALQSGDPLSLAVAARGMCSQEDAALLQALLRTHRPQVAMQIMDRSRQRLVDFNASIIVDARSKRR
jgi:hypothetical protein